jgi:hypothetical protein
MRELATSERIEAFFRSIGRAASEPCRVYLTGGATAVILGFRPTPVDIDLAIHPESDEVLRAIPRLKEELRVNVELAAPHDFIAPLPGWQERSLYIRKEGPLALYHYDLYAQVLSKLERGHAKDLDDARRFLERGLVEPSRLLELFETHRPDLPHPAQVHRVAPGVLISWHALPIEVLKIHPRIYGSAAALSRRGLDGGRGSPG